MDSPKGRLACRVNMGLSRVAWKVLRSALSCLLSLTSLHGCSRPLALTFSPRQASLCSHGLCLLSGISHLNNTGLPSGPAPPGPLPVHLLGLTCSCLCNSLSQAIVPSCPAMTCPHACLSLPLFPVYVLCVFRVHDKGLACCLVESQRLVNSGRAEE